MHNIVLDYSIIHITYFFSLLESQVGLHLEKTCRLLVIYNLLISSLFNFKNSSFLNRIGSWKKVGPGLCRKIEDHIQLFRISKQDKFGRKL